jgi:hypothetical protein
MRYTIGVRHTAYGWSQTPMKKERILNSKAIKSFFVIVLTVLATVSVSAQDAHASQKWYNSYAHAVDGDSFFINAGIGFGPTGSYDNGIPPISASLDYKLPVKLPITAGLITTFSTWKWSLPSSTGDINVTYTNFGIGARGVYHFNFWEKADVYAGPTLGWVIQSAKANTSGSSYEGKPFFLFGASVGARYFFTSFLGAYLELGYSGLQILGAGLTLKF